MTRLNLPAPEAEALAEDAQDRAELATAANRERRDLEAHARRLRRTHVYVATGPWSGHWTPKTTNGATR